MTRIVGRVLQIEPEAPAECELCGKHAELRPYGPNGERICYECGMANLATTNRAIQVVLDSVDYATADPVILERSRKQ